MKHVVTLGETLGLMKAQDIGALHTGPEFKLGIGGAESNVAIGATRLGMKATWIGCLGMDSVGDLVARELRAEGVDVHARRTSTSPTGLMIKERPTPAHQTVTYYRSGSAGSSLAPEDVDPTLIRQADLLHVTGISLALSDSARRAIYYALDLADSFGVPISFDINHRTKLWDAYQARPHYKRVAERARYLFAGVDEANILLGSEPPPSQGPVTAQSTWMEQTAREIALATKGEVILKDGSTGAYALTRGRFHSQPAVTIDPVDTVGAGDAFVSGYVTAVLAGESVSAALELGVQVGAFACLSPGDWEGLPRLDALGLLGGSETVSR